jgi:hypothetical protein
MPFDDPRYHSGTSLSRTSKEERLDSFEMMLGEVSDGLYLALKKLTAEQIKELHQAVADRIRREQDG